MKKQFKNLMIATILVVLSATVNAQTPNWLTNGNTATAAYRLGTNNAVNLKVISNNKIRMTFNYALTNSNIGMGTTSPLTTYGVHIYGGIGDVLAQGLYIQRADATPSNQDCALGIAFSSNLFSGGGIGGGSCGFILTPSANTPSPDMAFSTNKINPQLIIKYSGNVGIGTNAPTAKLSVNGTADNTTGAWGVFSDSRVKKVIADFTDGLNVIKQIRTIKFNYNENAPFKAEGEQIGVVAQELEKVAPYMVSKKTMGDMKDLREVNNQAYPFLLINAVKELAAENEELKAQLSATNARLDALENKTTSSSQNTSQAIGNNATDAQLYQIAPNPFSQKAIITFRLPSNASNAQLLITDAAGKTVKTYSLSNGSTQQEIYANNLTAGVYHYSLLVNGKMIDSKQMVIIK